MGALQSQIVTLYVQNLAGTVLAIELPGDATVADLKHRVHSIRQPRLIECALSRIRFFIIVSEEPAIASAEATMRHQSVSSPLSTSSISTAVAAADHQPQAHVTLDDDRRTLASYGVVNAITVHVVVHTLEPGVHLRTFGHEGAVKFDRPRFVCVATATDEAFVADGGSDWHGDTLKYRRIHVLRTSDGTVLRTYGGTRPDASPFVRPLGMCLNEAADELIVQDSGIRILVLRASDGAHLRTYTNLGNQLQGICVLPQRDEIFVACPTRHCVMVLRASDGVRLREYGGVKGNALGQFHEPHRLCVSASTDELFVCEKYTHRVQVLRASDGAPLRCCGGPLRGTGVGSFHEPFGVSVCEARDELFIADSGNNRVQVFRASDGEFLRSMTSWAGRIREPCDVFASPDGELFVANAGSDQVCVFSL